MLIASTFAFYDGRFRVVKNQGYGLIAAYQTGLALSAGNIISRMDADDIMPEDRLMEMTNALKLCRVPTVVTGKVEFFSDDVLGPGTVFYERWLNER